MRCDGRLSYCGRRGSAERRTFVEANVGLFVPTSALEVNLARPGPTWLRQRAAKHRKTCTPRRRRGAGGACGYESRGPPNDLEVHPRDVFRCAAAERRAGCRDARGVDVERLQAA